MGKSKRIKKKIKENIEEKLRPEQEKAIAELEQKIRSQMEDEQYAEVLESLAELVTLTKTKDAKPEFLYDGAYSYFMLGDYERAASWVDNVLTFDSGNIPARILLARICILEDRVDDGLAIFDFVLKNASGRLSDDEKDEIEDMISYYMRRDEDKIRKQYPNIASFFDTDKKPAITTDEPAIKKDSVCNEPKQDNGVQNGSAKDILKALREKVIGNKAEVTGNSEPKATKAPQKESKESENNAREILQALRDKVLKHDTPKEELSGPQEKSAVSTSFTPSQPQKPVEQVQNPTDDSEQRKRDVLAKKISIHEKIRLLNAFAGSYYYQGNPAAAKNLLIAALELDSCDMTTLTNMAWTLIDMGEHEKALKLATQAQITDFSLIRILREA